MLGKREVGNEAGKCRMTGTRVYEEGLDLLQGQNFVQATRCVKFSMFEFVRHVVKNEKVKNDLQFFLTQFFQLYTDSVYNMNLSNFRFM